MARKHVEEKPFSLYLGPYGPYAVEVRHPHGRHGQPIRPYTRRGPSVPYFSVLPRPYITPHNEALARGLVTVAVAAGENSMEADTRDEQREYESIDRRNMERAIRLVGRERVQDFVRDIMSP